MNNSFSMKAAAILGCTGVILGALGAHALEASLSADALDSFKTGVRYQVWHAIGLLAIGLSGLQLKGLKTVSVLWVIGVLMFSGSIYLLSTQGLSGVSFSWLGPVTPVGGLLLIIGWALLFKSALSSSKKN